MEIKHPWTPLSGGYWGLPLGYIQLIYPTTFSCFCWNYFCHTLLTNLTKFGLVYLINKAKNSWKQKSLWSSNLANCVNCSVFTYFQNILRGSRKYPYPHHGGNWKFGGVGEVRGPRNSRGESFFPLIIFFHENKLFPRGWGRALCLTLMENPGRWRGGGS